jgi:PAS domain S-box-containing protein
VKRTLGLRAALAFLVLIAIAPVFGVVVQASLAEQQARLARAEASLKSLVELSAAHQDGLIEGARQMLTAIASSPPIYENDLQACMRYLEKLRAKYPLYANFGLLDAKGRVTCRGTPDRNTVIVDDRLYFRAAVASGRFSVGEFQIGRTTGKPSLTFGMPVYREGSRGLRGVLFASLDLEQVGGQLGKIAISPEVTLFVTDIHGMVLASAGSAMQSPGSKLRAPFLREAVSAGLARRGNADDSAGRDWRYAVQPVGRPEEGKLFVLAAMSSAEVLAPAAQRLYLQLGALALITLFGAAVAWVFGDRVVARPIGRILKSVDTLLRQDLRTDTGGSPAVLLELRELDERFRDMAGGLAERSEQRDKAMAEMANQTALLESILESIAEGLIVIDHDCVIIHANAAARRILPGLDRLKQGNENTNSPAVAWDLFDVDGVTPLPQAGRPAMGALAGGDLETFRYAIRGLLSGGAEKIIQVHSRALLSLQGEQYGAVLVFSDITADYGAEQTLKDSERRYRTLFESNPHPMWVYDVETLRFLTVNDAAVAAYGYSVEEFMTMTGKDIRPAEDVPALLQRVRDGKDVHAPQVWRHRLKNGRLIYVEISSHTLDYTGRRARMVLAHDVTQRQATQQALEHLNATLERRVEERTRELAIANRELESFAYSVSHDLRAPLQVIDGFSRALVARYGQALDEKAQHYFERIRENTRQMAQLIDDLLSLAHVTRSEINTEPVDLAFKAGQIVERLRQRDAGRAVAVEVDQNIVCCGDARLLAVVLENLIENAWKFTMRTPAARIRIGRREGENGEAVIYVADNGAGFDMAYHSKLFNAFQRLHAASEFAGTGIGLATVHRIVTRHGGRVWAESSPGQGATFHFTVQAGASHEQQPDSPG